MNVAKTLLLIRPQMKGASDLDDKAKQILRDLGQDSDMDVKFYSQRALQTYT